MISHYSSITILCQSNCPPSYLYTLRHVTFQKRGVNTFYDLNRNNKSNQFILYIFRTFSTPTDSKHCMFVLSNINIMDLKQKKEFQLYRRLRWTKENGRELYLIYYDPLIECVHYLRWKHRDRIYMRCDEPEEEEYKVPEEKDDEHCCLYILKLLCCTCCIK
jgi:hypothetical protein